MMETSFQGEKSKGISETRWVLKYYNQNNNADINPTMNEGLAAGCQVQRIL